jgi:hypothetical protein
LRQSLQVLINSACATIQFALPRENIKLKKLLWFVLPCFACTAALAAGVGCEQSEPAEYPTKTAAKPKPNLEATPVAASSVDGPRGTRWASAAPASEVTEVEGNRIVLGAGQRCKSYRHLPSTQFGKDTLVEDACLELQDNTVIEIDDGATLAIVATNGLLIGRNVIFRAKGHSGNRGSRGRFASIDYTAATDDEIRALCVEHTDGCACPSDESSLAGLRGHAGSNGLAGGSLRLIAAELYSPSNLAGFAIDVTGGAAGPAGESGVRECTRGAVRCASPGCAAGIVAATSGADGRVVIAFGSAKGAAFAQRMQAATAPAHAVLESAPGIALLEQTSTLDAEALQKGWQRRSGEDPY